MLISTSSLDWKVSGNSLKGYPCHSRNRKSLERYSRYAEKFTLRNISNLSLFNFKKALEFNDATFGLLKSSTMPSTSSVP